MNIHTGRMTRVETNPGYFQGWMTDWDGHVRFAIGHPDSRGRALEDGELLRQLSYYRPEPDAEWQVVHTTHFFDGSVFVPVAFTADNKSLYVATNEGRDTTALYTFDPATGQLGELILADDRADVGGGLALSPRDRRPLWVSWQYERPERAMLDEEFAALQATIDGAFPDNVNRITGISRDESRMLIHSGSDRDPGTYYLYDKAAGTIEFFGPAAPLDRSRGHERHDAHPL